MARYTQSPFPIRYPRECGTLQTPLCLPPGLAQEDKVHTEEITKEGTEGKTKERTKKSEPVPYFSPADAMIEGDV